MASDDVPPSPKSQEYVSTVPVQRLENCTVSATGPEMGVAVKSARGALLPGTAPESLLLFEQAKHRNEARQITARYKESVRIVQSPHTVSLYFNIHLKMP